MKLLPVICTSFFLVACGGGGGDSPAAPTPLAAVALTEANEVLVTGVTVEAAMGSTELRSLLPVGVETTTAISSKRVLSRLTTAVIQKISEHKNSPASVTGAVVAENCGSAPNSGTYRIDDFGGTTAANATFTNCNLFDNGVIIDGTIEFSGLTESATSAAGKALFNVTVTEPGFPTAQVTGDLSFSVSGMGTTAEVSTLTGTHLAVSEGTQNRGIFDFNFHSSYNNTTGVSTDTANFILSTAVIDGSVRFKTLTPFQTATWTSHYPSSGVGTMTGAGFTVLRVTALGNETAAASSQVKIERSNDGGTSYPFTRLVTWNAL